MLGPAWGWGEGVMGEGVLRLRVTTAASQKGTESRGQTLIHAGICMSGKSTFVMVSFGILCHCGTA
jgi:hypothetical protein